MKPEDYLKEFPLATRAIGCALASNESKHGEGVTLRNPKYEIMKMASHLEEARFRNPLNDEDNCLHLTSAVTRGLKALESLLKQRPEYVDKYNG